MSDESFICETCGQTHEGLPLDYGFRLPDEVHALDYIERYRRSRSNADLCTLDEARYFFRGIALLPFAGSDDEFGWGLWVEVDRTHHDAYVSLFDGDASSTPRIRGRLANEIPGYGGTMGIAVEVEFQPQGDRPKLFFPAHESHPLAVEQRRGITRRRHHDILEAVGFFRKNTGTS